MPLTPLTLHHAEIVAVGGGGHRAFRAVETILEAGRENGMKKRDERRRLEVRRERLRALTDQQAGQAAGGVALWGAVVDYPDGRIGSRCCN